jgi:hypothetical protein
MPTQPVFQEQLMMWSKRHAPFSVLKRVIAELSSIGFSLVR